MSVAVDSAPTDATSNSATSQSIAHTVGAISNGALLALVCLQHAATGVACHWDTAGTNQPMVLIGSASDAGNTLTVYLFGLVAPTQGTKNLQCTWTTASDCCLAGASFSGVNQTGGATSFAHFTTAAATGTPTITVPSAVGDFVVGVAINSSGSFNPTGNTQIFADNVPNNFSGMGNMATGAATVTLTGSPSVTYAYIAVDIVAAAGAAAKVAFQPQYQMAPMMAQ